MRDLIRFEAVNQFVMAAGAVEFPFAAFTAQTRGVGRQVEGLRLVCEDGRGVGCGARHVEVSDLLLRRRAGEVSEGEELGCSWCCHVWWV